LLKKRVWIAVITMRDQLPYAYSCNLYKYHRPLRMSYIGTRIE